MILSIFPNVKPLPTKEEKGVQAKYASKPHYPAILDFSNEDDLINIITKNAWSPNIFSGHRSQVTFIQTDLMVLDIDDGLRIEEAEQMISNMGLTALCLPSTSHTEEFHRFRIIFPLSRTITDRDSFKATMEYLANIFPADRACVADFSRFYFGCKFTDGFWIEGDLLEPVIAPEKLIEAQEARFTGGDAVVVGESLEEIVESLYGEKRNRIPEQISYFLEHAHSGMAGEFHTAANAFLFVSAIVGCEYERIAEVFAAVCPDPLDAHDTYLLDKATQEGYNKRDENFKKDDL